MNSKNKDGDQLLEADLTRSVIGCFFDVHRELGFGYREYIYALALERDLVAKGHRVDREVAVMVYLPRRTTGATSCSTWLSTGRS